MTRILLVGTGITSAVTGSIIKQELPKAELIFWDKARGSGGRMSTFRNAKDSASTLDLGAQYITTTSDYANRHSLFYQDLKEAGILAPLTAKVGGMKETPDDTLHYVTPNGVSSLVKHFLQKCNSEIQFGYHIENINSIGKKWEVKTQTGVKDCFDIVVLTMPIPQILGLTGQVKELIESQKTLHKHLKSVEYSSRYALGLFYEKGAQISLKDDNSAEYILNDPIIRFVAIDNLKRGRDDVSPSVVAHTSVPFGKANVEKTPADMEPSLVAKIKEMFPHWPEPQSVKCQKWRYSQVSSAYPGLPGAVEIGEGLIAGGDGFTHSNFDGCIESAKTLASSVIELSGSSNT